MPKRPYVIDSTGKKVELSNSDSPSINVKWSPYNTTGDGSTDDYTSIDTVDTAAMSAKDLNFPAGTYLIGSTTTINSRINLEDGAVIKPDNGAIVTINKLGNVPDGKWIDTSLGGSVVFDDDAYEYVKPEWWGIDGSADNVQIGEAITAAKRIFFSNGASYSLTDEVSLLSNRELLCGSNVTFTQGTNTKAVFKGLGVSNIKIKGGKYVGPSESAAAASSEIGLIHFGESGNRSSNIKIHEAEVTTCRYGIYASYVDNLWVKDCYVHDVYQMGIIAPRSTNFHIKDNTITNVSSTNVNGTENPYGIQTTGDLAGGDELKNSEIVGNIINGVQAWDGIMSHDCTNLTISQNICNDVRNGIDIGIYATTTIQRVIVSDNMIYGTDTNSLLNNLISATYKWTASGSGTNEYYVELSGGGDPSISSVGGVNINGSYATEGSVGSLNAGEWDYGDNDSLGYSTIYVRLSDGTDPDTKSSGYVQWCINANNVGISFAGLVSNNDIVDAVANGNIVQNFNNFPGTGAGGGIFLSRVKNLSVNSNLVKNIGIQNSFGGIHVGGTAENVSITGNVLDNASSYGLYFFNLTTAKGIIATGNSFRNASGNMTTAVRSNSVNAIDCKVMNNSADSGVTTKYESTATLYNGPNVFCDWMTTWNNVWDRNYPVVDIGSREIGVIALGNGYAHQRVLKFRLDTSINEAAGYTSSDTTYTVDDATGVQVDDVLLVETSVISGGARRFHGTQVASVLGSDITVDAGCPATESIADNAEVYVLRWLYEYIENEASWNPLAQGYRVGTSGWSEATVSMTGAMSGDEVRVSFPTTVSGIMYFGNVTALNTVKLSAFNARGINGFDNVADTHTGDTNKTVLKSHQFPAGHLGSRGGFKLSCSGLKSGSAGNKTIFLDWGTQSYTVQAAANDTNDWKLEAIFGNANDQAVQSISWAFWNGITITQGYEAATENTANATTVSVECQLDDGSDSVSARNFMIETIADNILANDTVRVKVIPWSVRAVI